MQCFDALLGYQSEVIESRLMDLLDPSRHVHPGIAYDFYSGYIVVIADHLKKSVGPYGTTTTHTLILGELPPKVQSELIVIDKPFTKGCTSDRSDDFLFVIAGALEQRYRIFEQVETHTVKMKIPPVDVLNILGNLGYRVIGTSSPEPMQVVWTLEYKDFEKMTGNPNDI